MRTSEDFSGGGFGVHQANFLKVRNVSKNAMGSDLDS